MLRKVKITGITSIQEIEGSKGLCLWHSPFYGIEIALCTEVRQQKRFSIFVGAQVKSVRFFAV